MRRNFQKRRTIGDISPDNISNLKLWLDASDSSTMILSGSDVNQWGDKSGNFKNVTQTIIARKPEYVIGGQNGYNIVRMSNADTTYLFNSTNITSNPATVFLAMKGGQTTDSYYMDGRNTSLRMAMFARASTRFSLFSGNDITNESYTEDDTFAVHEVIFSPTATEFKVNRSLQTLPGNTGSQPLTAGITIGARFNNLATSDADMGELLIYQGVVSDENIDLITSYLMNKWGV